MSDSHWYLYNNYRKLQNNHNEIPRIQYFVARLHHDRLDVWYIMIFCFTASVLRVHCIDIIAFKLKCIFIVSYVVFVCLLVSDISTRRRYREMETIDVSKAIFRSLEASHLDLELWHSILYSYSVSSSKMWHHIYT